VAKPATRRPRLPSPGRLGLIEARASADLARLGWTTDDYVELLWSLSRAPDADVALRTMVRLADALGAGFEELNAALLKDRCLRGRLFALLGSSLALGDHLVANPQTWQLLQGSVSLPTVDELRREVLDCVAETPSNATLSALRMLYRNRLMVLAALDVAPTAENEPVLPFATVGAHLSDLADAALTGALEVAMTRVCEQGGRPRLAVIAMGKCGARELNYVSDIDVIFVGETADALETRVAGETMRLASEVFFEVDAALRPEGRHGALVRTLESHVSYYKRWAKTWEFQALLKARFAAGDAELGGQYVSALMPMVWTASEREDFVTEVQAMRRRVEELVPADVRDRELKLGTGGLRDVEFAVQLLQLVHGRAD
jgi:glutamate-ammonia-ligase adenylyltransferase